MNTAIQAIKEVRFNGDRIRVIEEDGRYLFALKPISDALGLKWSKQVQNIKNDPVLHSTMSLRNTVGHDGRAREMLCLPLEYLNGWLFKIPASRYTGERRDKIIRYQRECYSVLHRHFFPDKRRAEAPDDLRQAHAVLADQFDRGRKQGAAAILSATQRAHRAGNAKGAPEGAFRIPQRQDQ